MTRDEFLNKLGQLSLEEWSVGIKDGAIRLHSNKRTCIFCPITAVAMSFGHVYTLDAWRKAGDEIGLSYGLADEMVDAADDPDSYESSPRQQLLKAIDHLPIK